MENDHHDWLKLAILTKSLCAKLLALSSVRLRDPKKLGFSESSLINRSHSRPKCSCLFK